MARAPDTLPADFATAIEMAHYFLARNHGDAEAAAQEMEGVLRRDRRLYKAMVNDLVRIVIEENAVQALCGTRAREGDQPGVPGVIARKFTVSSN